jgi:hypothetical protein
VSELELESEVIEALCIPVLAKDAKPVAVGALQRAIARTSPLSDLYLGEISGRPVLVNSWAKAHSGEAPIFFSADSILQELTAGRIVPGILANRLRILDERSKHPFLKQWAYEFQRLIDRLGEQSDGYWEHFIEGERGRSIGQFVARRGHFARSAYLRTLSFAFDCWDMPENLTCSEAMYATPADFTFLRMPPGDPPSWVELLASSAPVSQDEWQRFLGGVVENAAEDDGTPELLYLNAPMNSTATYQAEIELISCLYEGNEPQPEEVFHVHQFLLGRVELPRTRNCDISIEQRCPDNSFPCSGGGHILPALLPSVARYVGYFHSDLIQRIPYLPANYSRSATLLSRPHTGGMDLLLGDRPVGEIKYWNWQWSPTYDKALGPHCGISLTVSRDCCRALLSVPGMMFSRYWRATVLTRKEEYGKWEEKTLVGVLP